MKYVIYIENGGKELYLEMINDRNPKHILYTFRDKCPQAMKYYKRIKKLWEKQTGLKFKVRKLKPNELHIN